MSNGDVVVGMFNRSDAAATVNVNFDQLGISGSRQARDLWSHTDEGTVSALTATLPAHGCKIVRLSK
ncbi:MAG: hypothetical protein IJU62_08760 [Muribaculaceae bacterium]|nr:hypothetical protein [Muribaculaceae bacterium]